MEGIQPLIVSRREQKSLRPVRVCRRSETRPFLTAKKHGRKASLGAEVNDSKMATFSPTTTCRDDATKDESCRYLSHGVNRKHSILRD